MTPRRTLGALVAVVALTTLSPAATVGRYRVLRTDLMITDVLARLGSGMLHDKRELSLDRVQDLITVDRSTIRLWVDGQPRQLHVATKDLDDVGLDDLRKARETVTLLRRRITGYVADTKHAGSIQINCSGWTKSGIHGTLVIWIADNHLKLTLYLSGRMQRLSSATVIIDAQETAGGTAITGTIFATAPTKNCRIVRRIAYRIMAPLIDTELAKMENKGRQVAAVGEGGLLPMVVDVGRRISQRGLGWSGRRR